MTANFNVFTIEGTEFEIEDVIERTDDGVTLQLKTKEKTHIFILRNVLTYEYDVPKMVNIHEEKEKDKRNKMFGRF